MKDAVIYWGLSSWAMTNLLKVKMSQNMELNMLKKKLKFIRLQDIFKIW
jgi:hypothetical protein